MIPTASGRLARLLRRHGTAWGCGLAALAVAVAPVLVAHAQPAAPAALTLRQRLEGVFHDIPGAGNGRRRDEGIARAVEALFVLIRPLAESRITEANPVFPTVRIAFHDGLIDVTTPPVHAVSPEDGTRSTVQGLDNETNQLVQSLTSDALVQTSWREAGSRTTRFVPSADGQRLTLHVQIRSGRLPVPVRYTMSYAR